MPQISRRTFLAGLGASAVPGTLQGLQAAQNSRKVIVIGAGLAGLAAAYELRQAGVDVTVVEQSERAGGRILTLRGHFDNDAWVDVGGQTSGAGYANFFYYSTKLGLQFEQQESVEGGGRPDILLHMQGELYSYGALLRDPAGWPLDLKEEEKPLAPMRLLGHYLNPIATTIQTADRVLATEFVEYDKLSLRQLLQQLGASDAAIQLIDHTLNYNSVDTVSALSVLRDAVRRLAQGRGQGGAALNLANGNSSLPEAFADELGDVIRYGNTVKGISQDERRVALRVETNGQSETLYADRVVVAIPFTALRKISIDAGLPASRQKIIDELPYTQIVQSYLQTSSKFWEADGPVAMLISDGPLERVFNASSKMKDGKGLLINWVNGIGTKKLRGGSAEQHLANVVSEMEKVWPGCGGKIEQSYAYDWGQSYVEGAYAHYAPGQMAAHAAEIPQAVGRLHFAGEHTELVAPGMEGALTSGKRAAEEILKGD